MGKRRPIQALGFHHRRLSQGREPMRENFYHIIYLIMCSFYYFYNYFKENEGLKAIAQLEGIDSYCC